MMNTIFCVISRNEMYVPIILLLFDFLLTHLLKWYINNHLFKIISQWPW